MGRVRALQRGYDGAAIREAGEEFDFHGRLGSWMEPLDGTFEEWGDEDPLPVEVEAPEATLLHEPGVVQSGLQHLTERPARDDNDGLLGVEDEPAVSEQVADMEAQVAKFDHDGDGKVGGSRKGGLARRKTAKGGLRTRS